MRARLRPLLEREYGVDGAAYLIDRPPGGWADLVTNRTLERELGALRQEIRADMADLRTDLRDELRAQTWQLAKLVIAAQGVVVAAVCGFGALLRFA